MNYHDFAEVLGISHQTIQEIINGEKSITVDIAIRLGKALGNGLRLWLNIQQKVDVWDALQSHQQEYNKVMTLV
ncbi:MAG: HigA family addiction module antitoxin [Dolichospermum sp.]